MSFMTSKRFILGAIVALLLGPAVSDAFAQRGGRGGGGGRGSGMRSSSVGRAPGRGMSSSSVRAAPRSSGGSRMSAPAFRSAPRSVGRGMPSRQAPAVTRAPVRSTPRSSGPAMNFTRPGNGGAVRAPSVTTPRPPAAGGGSIRGFDGGNSAASIGRVPRSSGDNVGFSRRSFFSSSPNGSEGRGNSFSRGAGIATMTPEESPRGFSRGAAPSGPSVAPRRGVDSGRSVGSSMPSRLANQGVRSVNNGLPQSYANMYNRLGADPGRQDWLSRNGYGNPAFGVGNGFNDRLGGRRGFGGFDQRIGRFGLDCDRKNWGRWSNSCRRDNWVGWCGNYFRPNCFPRTCVSSWGWWPYSGFSAWGWGGWGWSDAGWGLWDYPGGYPYAYAGDTYNYYDNDYVDVQPGYLPSVTQTVPPELQSYGQQAPQTGAIPQTTSRPTSAALAMQAFYRGDYDTARREFIRAIIAQPDDPELLMMYGYAHFATGDYLVAAMAIRRALKDDPTLIEAPVDILALYSSPDALNAHMSNLEGYLQQNTQDVDARFVAGFVRYAAGRPGDAQPYLAACAASIPQERLYLLMRDAAMRAASRPQPPPGAMNRPYSPAPGAIPQAEILQMSQLTPS